MKKLKGAINSKLIIAVLAVLIVGGGIFAFTKGASGSKAEVAKALMGLKDEYSNTINDFAPDFGTKEMMQKYSKDGIFSADINLNTDYFKSQGIDSAGLTYSIKNNPKENLYSLTLDANGGSLSASADLTLIKNDVYLNIPMLYDNAFKIVGDTVGADIQDSALVKFLGADLSEYKDLKFDFTSLPRTTDELKKDFSNYIKTESNSLIKNLEVTKSSASDDETAKINNLLTDSSRKITPEKFELKFKADDIKAVMKKSSEYIVDLQKRELAAIGFNDESALEDISSSIKEAQEKIDEMKIADPYIINVFIENGKVVAINTNISEEEKISAEIYFLGSKNTTDNMILNILEDDKEKTTISSNMSLSDSANIINVNVKSEYDEINYTETYKPTDKTLKVEGNFNEEVISLSGKFENIEKGKGYNFIFDNISIPGIEFNLSGNLNFSTETPEINAPENAIEILKLDESEIQSLMTKIEGNVQSFMIAVQQLGM